MATKITLNPLSGQFDEVSEVTLANVGSSPNAQAASIASDQTLTLEPADGSNPGVVTTGTQTFAGNKTFTGSISASNLSGTNTGDQTITLSSDVTGSGTGAITTTVASIQGTTVSGTTGTGNVVFSTSPTLVTPALGTPSAAVLTNATGLPLTTGVTGTLAPSHGGTGNAGVPNNGEIPIGNGTIYVKNTITPGTGINITNGAGSVTIASTTSSATDIGELTFSALSNTANQDITGLLFSISTVRAFQILLSVSIVATGSLFEVYDIKGIYNGVSWTMSQNSAGDNSLVTLHITNAGQVQIDLPLYAGFTSASIHARANTLAQ